MRDWIRSGSPWVWLTAGAVAISLLMVFGLLALITYNGLGHFWPHAVALVEVKENAAPRLGEFSDEETISAARFSASGGQVPAGAETVTRRLMKIGNRELAGFDFQWLAVPAIASISYPVEATVVERESWGNFYGFVTAVKENGTTVATGEAAWEALQARIQRAAELKSQAEDIEKDAIGATNYSIEKLRLAGLKLQLEGKDTTAATAALTERKRALERDYEIQREKLREIEAQLQRDTVEMRTASGQIKELALGELVRAYRPNQISLGQKFKHYAKKVAEFISDDPREANTEGGVFPAIFGTVLMVIVMSVFAAPFGIIAAIYLREYAKQGPLTSAIRIAVNNLAGVPSVVYGVFGLGFFVYFLGGSIDELFFAERLPAPTFGTPGLLWAALTLAILTVPVVIVSTEEGLARIPRAIREGSLALGATKAETLWRTVLPMATPAMMTGLILAIARAAGEVAPLMMVGVVKLAPTLALDGNFPFLHLDRKFMHLGFHIYDVGFQSPNVEAARPLVYATALLLVIIIVALNLAAIRIRNRLREKFSATDH